MLPEVHRKLALGLAISAVLFGFFRSLLCSNILRTTSLATSSRLYLFRPARVAALASRGIVWLQIGR